MGASIHTQVDAMLDELLWAHSKRGDNIEEVSKWRAAIHDAIRDEIKWRERNAAKWGVP